MCSIAGFISKNPLNAETALRLSSALLYHGQDRGRQSAGAFVLGKEGRLYKKAVHPENFIYDDGFLGMFEHDVKLALMHTRFPTCGDRTDKQAQPFTRENTVSVHNGYYFAIDAIEAQWGLERKSGVDSELITDYVETYGVKALPDFFETTDGPSAVGIYHNGELYVGRDDNPMSYAQIKMGDGNQLFVFASTESQLKAALDFTFLGKFVIKELKENRLYRVVSPFKLKRVRKWRRLRYGAASSYYGGGYGGYGSFGSSGIYGGSSKSSGGSTTKSSVSSYGADSTNDTHDHELVNGWKDRHGFNDDTPPDDFYWNEQGLPTPIDHYVKSGQGLTDSGEEIESDDEIDRIIDEHCRQSDGNGVREISEQELSEFPTDAGEDLGLEAFEEIGDEKKEHKKGKQFIDPNIDDAIVLDEGYATKGDINDPFHVDENPDWEAYSQADKRVRQRIKKTAS